MQCIETESIYIYDMYYSGRRQYQSYLYNLFWVCLSGAVGRVGRSIGGVVEVLGSNLEAKYLQHLSAQSTYFLSLYIIYISLYIIDTCISEYLRKNDLIYMPF